MRTTITHKIIIPIIALALLLTASFLGVTLYLFYNYTIETSEETLHSAAAAAREYYADRLKLAGQCAQRIAYDPVFASLMRSGSRDAIREFIQNAEKESGTDFTVILDAAGNVLVRSYSDIAGDDLSQRPLGRTALNGKATAAVTPGALIRLSSSGSAPVQDAYGRITGAVITGFRMDKAEYVEGIKRLLNTEVSVFFQDERIATTVRHEGGSYAVGTRVDRSIAEQVLAGREFFGTVDILGHRALACYMPLGNAEETLGMLFVGKYTDPQRRALLTFVWESLFVVCIALAIMIPVCRRVIGKVVAPIKEVAAAAEEIANGDLEACIQINTGDELELLGDAFNQMVEIRRQREVLSDTLMALHTASRDRALEIVLERAGDYLGISRAILLKDRLGERTCEAEYEWCNTGFAPVLSPGDILSYETDLAGLYGALRACGNLLLGHGEVSGPYRTLHDTLGFTASAMFAVYCNGEQYGFIWFADNAKERQWDTSVARFLQNTANLISAILEQREATKKLMQNQTAYEAVLNNVDSYIFVADAATDRIIFANQAFKSTFAEHCEGHPAARYLHWRAPDFDASVAGETGGGRGYTEFFCERSGEWLAVSSEPITWLDGREVQLINCYDITAKKQFADTLEEKIEERTSELLLMKQEAEKARFKAEEAAQAKARFLANMSHEMRTPMNAVIGMTRIYKSAADPGRKEYCIEKIEEASTHLLGVINDILDISKIEAGKMEIALAEFSFGKMLERVGNVLSYSINQKEQIYSVNIDDAIPRRVISDEQRISQVLANLLSNAAKFTPAKGRIILKADLVSETAKDCFIAIAVTDTGIGISEEEQTRLFRSFSQADAGISRKFGGTGLGLAISQNIARSLGGDIVVDSAPGQGATFTATFRVQKARENSPEPAAQLPQSPAKTGGQEASLAGYRILLVEDVAINQEIVISLLEPTGIAIECADSGPEAIHMFARNPKHYQAILMDINMPEMDGYETTRRIRSLTGASGLSVPIIAMTANAFREDVEKCLACGMDDHMGKPLDIDIMIAKLERYILRQ